ncbi:hypothetical protein JGF61_23765 [Salmonella enterica subsp. enterica serovar Agona]|nr:hypothetical protein [Salmonella enterica subsp. enterica serovar Agona]
MAGTGFELPTFGMGGSAHNHCATTAQFAVKVSLLSCEHEANVDIETCQLEERRDNVG